MGIPRTFGSSATTTQFGRHDSHEVSRRSAFPSPRVAASSAVWRADPPRGARNHGRPSTRSVPTPSLRMASPSPLLRAKTSHLARGSQGSAAHASRGRYAGQGASPSQGWGLRSPALGRRYQSIWRALAPFQGALVLGFGTRGIASLEPWLPSYTPPRVLVRAWVVR